MAVIEEQVGELKGMVLQQDALNTGLQQRVQTAGEAEARAKVPCRSLSIQLQSHLYSYQQSLTAPVVTGLAS